MSSLRTKITQTQKQKLSQTLRSWLPILQADLESLPEALEAFKKTNPFLEIRCANEIQNQPKFKKKNFFTQAVQNSVSDTIEAMTLHKASLHEVLYEQINPPLFPTCKSQEIAYKIIEFINSEGYFECDKEALDNFTCKKELEKIRARFAHLEPTGVGAVDFKEALLFQLENCDINDECYKMAKVLLEDFENIQSYTKRENFNEALEVIKRFRIPPAIDFLQSSTPIVPDIFVYLNDDNLEIKINDEYYPEIVLDFEGLDKNQEYIASKIKEGKDLIDALEMRKATLYKIGLNIVENQYDFFFGGVLKPMRLKDLAVEMDRNPSTISRAISGKYLSCERGLIPLKDFFSTAIDKDTSNSSLKEFLKETISYENRLKPLSDAKLLKMIENKFDIKLSRRTITKYRIQLNIASSSERKKLYQLQV